MTGLASSLLGVNVYWKWEIVMGQDFFFPPDYISARGWDLHRGWPRDTRTGSKGRLREVTSSFFAQQPLKELSEMEEGIGQKVWSTLILHVGKKILFWRCGLAATLQVLCLHMEKGLPEQLC